MKTSTLFTVVLFGFVSTAWADYSSVNELDELLKGELAAIGMYRATIAQQGATPRNEVLKRMLTEHTVAARLLRNEIRGLTRPSASGSAAVTALSSSDSLGEGFGGMPSIIARERKNLARLESALDGPNTSDETKARLGAALLPRARARMQQLNTGIDTLG